MTQMQLIAAATAGAVCLAICAVLWALVQRRAMDRRVREMQDRLEAVEGRAAAAQASAEAFDSTLLVIDDGRALLASGEENLEACAAAFILPAADPQAMVNAIMRADPDHAARLRALFERGEPCAFEARGPKGVVSVEGRAAGALAWLRLTAATTDETALPSAARLAAFLDARPEPAWIAGADGAVQWANKAWLTAVSARDAGDAANLGLSLDKGADAIASEAANLGERRETTRWISVGGRRRALKITAEPLEGGGVAVWTSDATQAEEIQDALKRHVAAHDETLNHIAEAVAIFGPTRRLSFHNTAFADLWGLDPAWLAERPTHGEILDRLRQRQRLPETPDYAKWKAAELARYETLGPQPDDRWTLPDGRTLRLIRQPHPMGGLLLLYSDITGEVRLRAQYNALIQVQQATLDKLSDAVVVFGSNGRLRLHNEAFARFWAVSEDELVEGVNFERVVELCVPRLHDMAFWAELKGRVGDPDPEARAPTAGEIRNALGRIVVLADPAPARRRDPDRLRRHHRRPSAGRRPGRPGSGARQRRAAEARVRRQRVLRTADAADDDHRLFGTARPHGRGDPRTRPLAPVGRAPGGRPAGPVDRRRARHRGHRRRRDGARPGRRAGRRSAAG